MTNKKIERNTRVLESMLSRNKKTIIIGFILIGFFFVLSYGTPLNYDDWAWGGALGMSRWANFYRDYNGRYAGNTAELIVTRLPVIRYLSMTVCSVLLVFSLGFLSMTKRSLSMLLSLVLILLMPTSMFNETFSWIAGYVNYIPGVLFAVWSLLILRSVLITEAKPRRDDSPVKLWVRVLRVIAVFIAFLVAELFVENTSLFIAGIALLVLIISFIKNRSFLPEAISLFVAAVAGNIIMFSNGAYRSYANGETYKQVHISRDIGSLIRDCWYGYTDRVASIALYKNLILIIAVSVLALYLLFRKSNLTTWIRAVGGAIISLFTCLVFVDNSVIRSAADPIIGRTAMAILSLIYLLFVLATAVASVKDRNKRIYFVILAFAWAVAVGPMLITTPCHNRSLILSYFVLIVFAISLLEECEFTRISTRWMRIELSFVVGCLMLIMSFMFINNRKAYEEKVAYVMNHKTDKSMILPNLPYPEYVYKGSQDRITEIFDREFKLYYGINADTEITLVPYSEWKGRGL